MLEGLIIKALGGFYYVRCADGIIACRARGRFRLDGKSPLVGDRVELDLTGQGSGCITKMLPRRNFFIRPAVANLDYLVIMCANVNPVTAPFLVDRVAVTAHHAGVGVIVCVNKCDLDPGDGLFEIYSRSGFPVLRTSAQTGQGVPELMGLLRGKVSAFTGNSGVGKSSLLNAIDPRFNAPVGEVSDKLGRGRHTTRHVELFDLGGGTYIADTPGFASFDLTQMSPIKKEELQNDFPDFVPYLGHCRFDDCAHLREPGCAVLGAVAAGEIHPSRHESYVRLYGIVSRFKDWEKKQ
ncbi:MAG: ribosome small subunit-dependent GTPase A [Butyricicoccus sp.]|nr:ribosome small subunit-dependent GTPase A [Butyricicoccus sp.]